MDNLLKASVDKKKRTKATVKISFVGAIALLGIVLAIYSIFTGKFLFFLWYFVAFILGLSYVIIRINAIFPSYVQLDGDKLIMSVWQNGVFPYKIPEKPNFLSDFMPEKLKKDEIALDEISEVYIGSNRFLSRHLEPERHPEILKQLASDKHFESNIKRMDFLLVFAKDGESCFMSVTDFDVEGLAGIIDSIERQCTGVQVFVGMPKLKRYMKK